MRTTLISIVTMTLVTTASVVSPLAAERNTTLIVCGTGLSPTVKTAVKTELADVIGEANVGDRVIVVVGDQHDPVANLVIPTAAGRARFRDRNVSSAMVAIAKKIEAPADAESALQVGFPRLAASYWSLAAGPGTTRILLVGTPEYHDPRLPFWSFRNGVFPSDAAITSTESSCPFRNLRNKRIPDDVQITFLTPTTWGKDQRHRDHILRWLRLATQQSIGGRIVMDTSNTSSAFATTRKGRTAMPYQEVHPDGHPLIGVWKLAEGATRSEFPEFPKENPGSAQTKTDVSPVVDDATLPARLPEGSMDGATAKQPTSADPSAARAAEINDDPYPLPEVHTRENHSETTAPESRPDLSETRANTSNDSGAILQNSQNRPATDVALSPTEVGQLIGNFLQSTFSNTEAAPGDSADQVKSRPQQLNASLPEVRDTAAPEGIDHNVDKTQQDRGPVPTVNSAPPIPAAEGQDIPDGPTSSEAERIRNVLDRIKALTERSEYPAALREQLQSHATAGEAYTAVIVTWKSRCPHADVNLKLADVPVNHDTPHERESGQRKRMEWAFINDVQEECWLNVWFTHSPITAQVQTIDLTTGSASTAEFELPAKSDNGRHKGNRRRSPAWHRIDLATLAPAR
jgi:hypothetical protein